jgi:hypothetical protein
MHLTTTTSSRATRLAKRTLIGLVSGAVASTAGWFSMEAATAATSGTLTMTKGSSDFSFIENSTDGIVATSFTVPSTSARNLYLGLQFRSSSEGSGYRTRVTIDPSGVVNAGFSRIQNSREYLLLNQPVGVTVKPGDRLNIEGSVTGTSPVALKVRAWVGGTKPNWQKSYSDTSSSRITSGTAVRAWGHLSSGASTSSVSVPYGPVGTTSTTTATTTNTSTTTTTRAVTSSGSKPSASTTGNVSSSLRRHVGNITVTKAGTVLEKMDIHGFVNVKAPNVIIRDSIVRGGRAGGNIGIITNYCYDRLLVQNVYIKPAYPSVWIDGVKGWDFTLDRVHVVGGVDNVKIHGDNVTIKNSLLENTDYYSRDPNQGGRPTHNDNVQILRGLNLVITNNTIRDTTNFTVLVGAEQGNVTLNLSSNWLDGGHCTVKLQNRTGRTQRSTVNHNKFGPNRKVSKCIIQARNGVNVSATGNKMESGGRSVSILWNNA